MPELIHKIQYFAAEGLGDGWYYRVQRLPAGGIYVKYEANLVHLNSEGYVEEEAPCVMQAGTPDAAMKQSVVFASGSEETESYGPRDAAVISEAVRDRNLSVLDVVAALDRRCPE